MSVTDSSDEMVRCASRVCRCASWRRPPPSRCARRRGGMRRGRRRRWRSRAGLTAGLLLATLTKDDERVTLQILGDGPLGGRHRRRHGRGTLRAYVKHPAGGLKPPAGGRPSLAAALGRVGLVNVIRDVGFRQPFSGQIALATGEIDEDVEAYLEKRTGGERARLRRALRAGRTLDFAAGILVQALPGSEGSALVAEARPLIAGGEFLRALAGARRDGEGVIAAALGDRLGEGSAARPASDSLRLPLFTGPRRHLAGAARRGRAGGDDPRRRQGRSHLQLLPRPLRVRRGGAGDHPARDPKPTGPPS